MKTRKEIRRQIVEDQQRNQDYLESKPSQEQSDVTLKVEHTPTPWIHAKAKSGHRAIYDATEKVQLVCFGEGQDEAWREPKNAKANAAFIVKAVNAHEELVTELKKAHSPLQHAYERDEAKCPTCKLIAKAERGNSMKQWRGYKKIEIFLDGKYICTTTWSPNLEAAKRAFLKSGYSRYASASKLTARYAKTEVK